MLNTSFLKLTKLFVVLLFLNICLSCKEEVSLNFSEISIVEDTDATIEINIPKAEGATNAAKQINNTLNQFVNNALDINNLKTNETNTTNSIAVFKKAYLDFKSQIGKTLYTDLPAWEVLVDGEIIYKSETLVSIAMNSSINTGGAHSNLIFKFFNFNIKTGKTLQTKDLINDIPAFTALAKKYYDKELLSATDDRISAFNNNDFKLPKNLGFNEEGVIIFYDTFITGSNNVIEFIVPYTLANDYLNF